MECQPTLTWHAVPTLRQPVIFKEQRARRRQADKVLAKTALAGGKQPYTYRHQRDGGGSLSALPEMPAENPVRQEL